MKIQSTKVFDGFSTVFRQWKAEGTHCKFLHGYGVSFKVIFEGEMDEKNWVMDFGRAKRSDVLINDVRLDAWLKDLLDHTMLISEDDPELEVFKGLAERGAVKLRILPQVGAERFALFLFDVLNKWCIEDTKGRVIVRQIELFEHQKNSAIVTGEEGDYDKFFEEFNKANENLSMVFASLYEYLGYPAGKDVGKAVAEEARKRGIPMNTQPIPSKTGFSEVAIYPVAFLDDFFKGGENEA